ncbi:hypothetical protein [Halobacillus sp. K22]|uniref:hypothetical protein n=1 Tax=Halobacillus sp. K22 TaxID=3457431 RepID=UPI003FCDB65F
MVKREAKSNNPYVPHSKGGVDGEEGLKSEKPFEDERYDGDSVDKHERMESANEYLGEKEIKQILNNSLIKKWKI